MTTHTTVNVDALYGRDELADHLAQQVGEAEDGDEFAWMDEIDFASPAPDEHLGQRLARELGSAFYAGDGTAA